MILHKTPAFLKWIYRELVWTLETDEKIIYLTFDDGPIPDLTEFVLDTLKKYEVKGTFFCVGDNLRKYPGIAKRAFEEGHLLGNHTYNHLDGWKTKNVDYISNIVRCQKHLIDLGAGEPAIFRPPYGKIKKKQIKQLNNRYQIIMWDVLSGDFSENVSPERCLKKTISATRKGSIVLFHDNIKAETNLKYTLPRYIEHFLNQGYRFELL